MRSRLPLPLALLVVVACSGGGVRNDGETNVPSRPIEDVLRDHTAALMRVPGVTGTAQALCDGSPCIKVFVTDTTPDVRRSVPDSLEGWPVRLELTGPFRPRRDTI